jgi:N-acetyl sugar amidotransferase
VKKTLVLIVADYPNSKGEPFLEEEVKVLEEQFEKIYFLQTNHSVKSESDSLYLPKNSTFQKIDLKPLCKINIYRKIRVLFSVLFIYQVFLALFKHKSTLRLSLFKVINYYLTKSFLTEKKLLEFVSDNNLILSETLFYSYWCDEHTLALAHLARKNPDFSFVTRVHGWDVYFERHIEGFLPFREYIFRYAKKILPISNDGRRYILNKRLIACKEKVKVAKLGVQKIQRNIQYRNENRHNNTCYSILTLSHINKIKRLDKLVDALCKLDNTITIHWHHIGFGELNFEDNFRKNELVKLDSLKNISYTFHGQKSKNEVQHFLEEIPIDLIVNCSDTEGVPVSLMEACSAGIPIIAFNVGGIPAVLKHGYNGFLIDSGTTFPQELLKQNIEKFVGLSRVEKLVISHNGSTIWEEKFSAQKNYSLFSQNLKNDFSTENNYIECNRCMVNSDVHKGIVLNKYGECDICSIIDEKTLQLENQKKNNYLEKLVAEIKSNKTKSKYDCVIGISGGVDSAFLVLKMKELGINPLLVHVDNGWNSELAVSNIDGLIKKLGFDLYTVVIEWDEIKDVVRSFLKASVIDIDWANEMCFVASLYDVAKKFKVKTILTGHQVASEGWMPETVVHYKLDLINFKDIHNKYGEIKLNSYPTIGYLKNAYYQKVLGIKYYYPLDYMDYNKEEAKKILIQDFGWRDYGQKHFESIFTRFYQAYILPTKFGIDKRIFHYSALITSGQLSKGDALKLITSKEYFTSGQMKEDKEFIEKKLGFTTQEFDDLLLAKPKNHTDYKSIINWIKFVQKIKNKILGLS